MLCDFICLQNSLAAYYKLVRKEPEEFWEWLRVEMGVRSEPTVNIVCPKLSRELIKVHLNIRIIPSGCNSFLPLWKKWKIYCRQATSLSGAGAKFEGVFYFVFFPPSSVRGRQGQACNRSAKCLQRGATEEERQEIRQGGEEERMEGHRRVDVTDGKFRP